MQYKITVLLSVTAALCMGNTIQASEKTPSWFDSTTQKLGDAYNSPTTNKVATAGGLLAACYLTYQMGKCFWNKCMEKKQTKQGGNSLNPDVPYQKLEDKDSDMASEDVRLLRKKDIALLKSKIDDYYKTIKNMSEVLKELEEADAETTKSLGNGTTLK